MNSLISVHIFQSQGVVVLVGKETDNSAPAERGSSLAQSHRQTTDLLAFAAQKNIPNRTELYLCARLPVLLKFPSVRAQQKYALTVYRALFGEDRDWTPCSSSQREIACGSKRTIVPIRNDGIFPRFARRRIVTFATPSNFANSS